MRVQPLPKRLFVITFCLAIISLTFSFQITHTQTNPLSLAKVLTGLQSKSSGASLSRKNTFITAEVRKRGVTFRLTPEIEKELRNAGASASLMRAIRLKSPKPTPNPTPSSNNGTPSATYTNIWVEQNLAEKGVDGIKIFANFSVYNMKGVPSDIVYRFRKNGVLLNGFTTAYKTSTGHLSARRYLKPGHTDAVYEDLSAFLPYTEFNLATGVHNLEMESAVINRDGTLVKQFPAQNLRLVIPGPVVKITNKNIKLGRMWVDYKVRENGILGMRVHVKMTLKNMKGQTAFLRVLFTKEDGTKLSGSTPKYLTKSGQTSLFRRLNLDYATSHYKDISMFIPYDEFGLPGGSYTLKMQADVVSSPSYKRISHLADKLFTYTKPK